MQRCVCWLWRPLQDAVALRLQLLQPLEYVTHHQQEPQSNFQYLHTQYSAQYSTQSAQR